MAEDRQALAMKYLQLLQSGVPAAEAFKQVYPKGVPTTSQQAAIDSKKRQQNQLAATGGTIAGLLGIKYGMNGLDSLGSASTVSDVATGASQVAGAAPSVPTGLSGSVVSTTPETAGAFDMAGVGSAGNYLLPAAGAFGAYNLATNDVSPARGVLQGAASGAAIGSGFGGVGAVPGAIIGGTLGLAKSLFGQHESTRDIAKKHTGQLLKASNDPNYQSYVQGMREQYNSAPPDPSKPFAGKYRTFEEYKAAGLDPKDLTGVYGNIKTFGPEWANLSQDQREQVTQGLIGANLYNSKKGEVEITDPNKAKQIYATIIKPQAQAVARPTTQTLPNAATIKQTGQFGDKLFQAINSR